MKHCLKCHTTFELDDWRCPECGYKPEMDNTIALFAPKLAHQNNTYEVDFFINLAHLEQGHFWFEARNRILLWAFNRYFDHAESFFEIGCGTGFVLQHFNRQRPALTLYASDLLTDGLLFASERVPAATMLQMDIRDIPYREEFDVIGAFDVIEHIEGDEVALRQLYQAVKPGGGILLSVPQHQFLWSVVDDQSYHKRRYSRTDLIRKVQDAGFSVLMTTSFVSLLLPVMFLSRSRKRNAVNDFDVYAEFKIAPVINSVLSFVMRIEVALIRLGLYFPMGGTRMLVARRPLTDEIQPSR